MEERTCPSPYSVRPCVLLLSFQVENLRHFPRRTPRVTEIGSSCYVMHGQLDKQLLPTEAEETALWSAMPTEREYFNMYGKPVMKPRHMKLYSSEPLTVHSHGHAYEAHLIDGGEERLSYLDRLLAAASPIMPT